MISRPIAHFQAESYHFQTLYNHLSDRTHITELHISQRERCKRSPNAFQEKRNYLPKFIHPVSDSTWTKTQFGIRWKVKCFSRCEVPYKLMTYNLDTYRQRDQFLFSFLLSSLFLIHDLIPCFSLIWMVRI